MLSLKVVCLTLMALIAFAANSILCRLALGAEQIDAASFTIVRLLAGAVTLAILLYCRQADSTFAKISAQGDWISAVALFVYAAGFSFAYIELDTATGALILFASVQLSMLLINLYFGASFSAQSWLGLVLAFAGFVYLIAPDLQSPSFYATLLMTVAGVAWGVYSIRGKHSVKASVSTTANFIYTLPMLLPLLFIADMSSATYEGLWLAVASGAVASGLGYTIWYLAVPHLKAELAAVSQLSVPIIAAIGGILFVGEALYFRLIFACVVILSGIALVIWAPAHRT